MQAFRYRVLTKSGETLEGIFSANGLQEAHNQLVATGHMVVLLEPVAQRQHDDSIIFTGGYRGHVAPAAMARPEQADFAVEMGEYLQRCERVLALQRELTAAATRDELELHVVKLKFLMEHPTLKLWQYQKKMLDKLFARVEREVERKEFERWEALGKKPRTSPIRPEGGGGLFGLRRLFGAGVVDNRRATMRPVWTEEQDTADPGIVEGEVQVFKESGGLHEESGAVRRIRYWYRVMNRPDTAKPEEVYAKARYEAVWLELQRFIGALLAFYLLTTFAAYWFLQKGQESFLIEISESTLFKQVVLFLFALYGILTLRRHFLSKHLLVDGVLFLVWVAVLWVLLG